MRSEKILVAEDETNIRQLLKFKLKQAGYTVQTAEDGERAIEILPDFQPDLVVLDIMMPEVTGIEVAKEIQENPDLEQISILVLSAISEGTDRGPGYWEDQIDAEDFISKPFEVDDLLEKVSEIL